MTNPIRFIIRNIPVIICVSILFSYWPCFSQQKIGFELPEGVQKLEIPFEEYSNLIVIPVTINNILTVRFILDTGAESAILTEKALGDLLKLQYVREIIIDGPGIVDSLGAYVASNVELELPFGVHANGINMLVLKEDYLELSKTLGEEIHGIIGYDVFSRFVVEIDYFKDTLTLYEPSTFEPRSSFSMVPIDLRGTKPFIEAQIDQGEHKDTLSLLIDTGASHAMLLDVNETNEIKLPKKLLPSSLGQGLGGNIPGYIGRMERCSIDKFHFKKVLVSIPQAGTYNRAIKRGALHGTIGGDLLSRFRVVIDYPNQKLYLKKGVFFRNPFEFDMSGLKLQAQGLKLDSLIVVDVEKNTPAERAGVKLGDRVLSINGFNLANSTLSHINSFLSKKPGVRIKLKLIRDNKKLKKRFRLVRMI